MLKLKNVSFMMGILFLLLFFSHVDAQPFIHPGLLQSNGDLARMKKAVADKSEPIYAGFLVFQSHPQSQFTYKMQGPMAMVGRNPTVGQGTYDADANAAYQNALMWALTGNHAYADKAIEIVNRWSVTLKSITGKDAVLMAGLGPFKMVNAAEILRYSNSGWTVDEIRQTERQFKEVIYPVIKDYAPFANGNWDSAALKTTMAIAIFCNDREMYEQALRYYADGAGDGSLNHYIINETGQCQESGRDQGHTQLGIAHLGDCAEMAWHQGLNLYAYADNLLLKGFEYTAKYNLGLDVPYVAEMDKTGKYLHPVIAIDGRGKLRPVYEEIYNHYVNRMGLKAPYTQQVAEKIRPELQGLPGADHVGFGTLLYSVPGFEAGKQIRTTTPAAPGGLIAKTTEEGNSLTWITAVGATSYSVKRAKQKNGPYQTLQKHINGSGYEDHDVQSGKPYYYTITATNDAGESGNAYPVGITTGLPVDWKEANINSAKGYAAFDGSRLIVTGGGLAKDSLNDQFNFVYQALQGDGSIMLRYVPQVSSQFTTFGITMRDGSASNAANVSLLVGTSATKQIEAPEWHFKLLSRVVEKNSSKVMGDIPILNESIVTNNRLTGRCWLKLERRGNAFTGYYSVDGKLWVNVGSVVAPLKKQLQIGIPVSSGVDGITTTVKFDHIAVNNKSLK